MYHGGAPRNRPAREAIMRVIPEHLGSEFLGGGMEKPIKWKREMSLIPLSRLGGG